MPHSERRRCGRIAVLGRLAHQHTALASGLMDLRPPFSTATTLVGVACKRAERRCARPRRAPSNWPMVDVPWMSWGGNTAPPRTESETDRCTATGRPDLRPPSNLAPLRLPLSSRSAWFDPLRPPAAHGPLPRHHTLTQLRRSREMSDELRCCVRTRVGGCSRCMACALQLANIFAILGPSTPNSLGIWDTRLRLHHTCCTARPAGMLPAGTGWSVVEFSSLPLL